MTNSESTEPPDHHVYHLLHIYKDTTQFFMVALTFYEARLKADIDELGKDPDLTAILSGDDPQFAIHGELEKTVSIRTWLQQKITEQKDAFSYHLSNVRHGTIRFLKSVGLLYLSHVKSRRDAFAGRRVSRHALDAVDQQIAKFDEKLSIGVFKTATTTPLLTEPIEPEPHKTPSATTNTSQAAPQGASAPPRVIGSIEIFDSEIRNRCLDLFAQFRDTGQHDRLDTVVTESTRIFEDRLRALSGAAPEITGVDLATYALGGKQPRIVLSSIDAEQEGAHLLFRGIFGFIRNSVHHKLVENLSPDRVLQIVAMIDYAISLLEQSIGTTSSQSPTALQV
jgi:uncharacterized protein (TIGR02391 family)